MSMIKRKIRNILVDTYVSVCRLFVGVKNRAIFISFSGTSYSDNPKPLSEKLHELAPEIEIVWLFKKPEEKKAVVPEYVKCVSISDKYEVMKLMATSKCIVNNCALAGLKKSKKQFFIQLWHGDRAFKKVLYDSAFADESFFLQESREGFCDLAISGSDYGDMQYRSAFKYTGKILTVGTPRDDVLLNYDETMVRRIKETLNIPEHKKIALYAPTLRRKNAGDKTLQPKQDIDLKRTLSKLNEITGDDWVFLVRAHPSVPGIGGVEKSNEILEVSAYEDMADLLLIADILITDFSSSAGDYALLHRPIVLFQSDYEEYLKKDRGLYFNMEDSPYFVAKNQEELEHLLSNMTSEIVQKNCDDILQFYGTKETGKASEVISKIIIQHICGGKLL